jgi:hypothetical protein
MVGSGSSIQPGNRRGMVREVGGNNLWSRLHPFCQERGVGTVEFGCCDACTQPWKLELGAGSVGGGRREFSYTKTFRVGCI